LELTLIHELVDRLSTEADIMLVYAFLLQLVPDE
jgi:hypothetical protein